MGKEDVVDEDENKKEEKENDSPLTKIGSQCSGLDSAYNSETSSQDSSILIESLKDSSDESIAASEGDLSDRSTPEEQSSNAEVAEIEGEVLAPVSWRNSLLRWEARCGAVFVLSALIALVTWMWFWIKSRPAKNSADQASTPEEESSSERVLEIANSTISPSSSQEVEATPEKTLEEPLHFVGSTDSAPTTCDTGDFKARMMVLTNKRNAEKSPKFRRTLKTSISRLNFANKKSKTGICIVSWKLRYAKIRNGLNLEDVRKLLNTMGTIKELRGGYDLLGLQVGNFNNTRDLSCGLTDSNNPENGAMLWASNAECTERDVLPHEFGHLFGAKHNPECDENNKDFINLGNRATRDQNGPYGCQLGDRVVDLMHCALNNETRALQYCEPAAEMMRKRVLQFRDWQAGVPGPRATSKNSQLLADRCPKDALKLENSLKSHTVDALLVNAEAGPKKGGSHNINQLIGGPGIEDGWTGSHPSEVQNLPRLLLHADDKLRACFTPQSQRELAQFGPSQPKFQPGSDQSHHGLQESTSAVLQRIYCLVTVFFVDPIVNIMWFVLNILWAVMYVIAVLFTWMATTYKANKLYVYHTTIDQFWLAVVYDIFVFCVWYINKKHKENQKLKMENKKLNKESKKRNKENKKLSKENERLSKENERLSQEKRKQRIVTLFRDHTRSKFLFSRGRLGPCEWDDVQCKIVKELSDLQSVANREELTAVLRLHYESYKPLITGRQLPQHTEFIEVKLVMRFLVM